MFVIKNLLDDFKRKLDILENYFNEVKDGIVERYLEGSRESKSN